MKKTPFITLEKALEIRDQIPTPFHIYDEAGIRANARALKAAFSWNKGFREYFAVKATPNPYILQILKEELPSAARLEEIMNTIGISTDLNTLGVDSACAKQTFRATKDIRDKYVLSRLAWDLGICDILCDIL